MIRAFQWDLARQVERLDFLQAQLPRYAAWGYQELYLHLEDAVHYPSLPGIGRDDAYTYEELGELVLTAARNGIRVVPIINLLGHTQYLLKHPEWRDLNEVRDEHGQAREHGQLCPLHPRTREVAEKLLRDISPYCTAGKVHVGLDESFHLGQCPRCQEEVARIGIAGHFAGHVNRLQALCTPLGLTMGLWADMLYFVPEAIPQLPRGLIAYDWYYYPFAKKPRVELFNFAEHDLHPALKKQGIAYYGCPMNGAFRHEPLPVFGDRLANISSWWKRCAAIDATGFLVTAWEPSRLALETTVTVDAAAASLWLEPQVSDATAMLAAGLKRVFKSDHARALARALLAADEYAFTGYARWQINDRWDVFAGNESLKPYQAEERFFRRLCQPSIGWPKALAASLAFRLYLAQRDAFVRAAARTVFKLRRIIAQDRSSQGGAPRRGESAATYLTQLKITAAEFAQVLQIGSTAARAMWGRTRAPQLCGPNEKMLQTDAHRLKAWREWLKAAGRNPAIIAEATPVCGAWQLQLMVHNFAPAAQKIVVEQLGPDGLWHELASRFTMEFRAQTARPRSKCKREFTVPLTTSRPSLRIALRGIGAVAISHITVTDGVVIQRRRDFSRKKILGRRARSRGLPDHETTSKMNLLLRDLPSL